MNDLNSQQTTDIQLMQQHQQMMQQQQLYDHQKQLQALPERQASNNVSGEDSHQTAHFDHQMHQNQLHQQPSFENQTTTFDAENTLGHAALTPKTLGSEHTISQQPTVSRQIHHSSQDDELDENLIGGYNELMAVNQNNMKQQNYNDDNLVGGAYSPSKLYNHHQYQELLPNQDAVNGGAALPQDSPQQLNQHQYQENRTQFAPRQMRPDQNVYNHNNGNQRPVVQTESTSTAGMNWNQQQQNRSQEQVTPTTTTATAGAGNTAPPTRFLTAKTIQTTVQPSQAQSPSSSLQIQTQGSQQQSSLMRQFSDKIKTQAERLQKLESYKKLCERRILDLEPNHALPITEEMLGQSTEATRDSYSQFGGNNNQNQQQSNVQDLKKQLALKEQDLLYAKQKAEKTQKENEYLKKELQEAQQKLLQQQQSASATYQPDGAKLKEQLKTLEEEKNALLDYIEESVNITQNASMLQNSMNDGQPKEAHRMTLNDLQNQVNQLQQQKSQLARQNEDLCKKLSALEKVGKAPNVLISGNQEETFDIRNLPTGLSARSPSGGNHPTRDSQGVLSVGTHTAQNIMSQGSLPQVQSIDYMVLDLNAVKQELMETQNQFNSTQNMLQQERQEKQDLIQKLEEAQSHIVDLEQLQMQQTQQTGSLTNGTATGPAGNPWQAPDTEYKVKLVEERDRLLDQKSELQDQIRQMREENDMLKVTLDQTQHELEGLVENHEAVTKQVTDLQKQLRDAQDLPRRLRQEAQGIRDQLDEKKAEVVMLQDEIKGLSMQAETNMDTLKQLKACNLRLEGQIVELRDSDETKVKNQTKQWEATIDDLNKDLQDAKATIREKESIFQKVERELRLKLNEVEDAHTAKTTLLRRIEDLNHEVRQLQALNERKESQNKEQTRQIEHLQFEVERVSVQAQKAAHEKNATQEMRKEDFSALEMTQQKVDRQGKVINKICRDVSKVQELVNSISKEFQMPNKIQPEAISMPTQESAHRSNSNYHMDEQLREANGFLKQIGEWLVSFAKKYKHAMKTTEISQLEIENANQQIKLLEGRCMTKQQEEYEAREQGKMLTNELHALKAEVAETQTLQRDGYEREERIQKKNQQLKTQIDGIKIQKEKLQLQIKTLLGDKETLKDSIEQKTIEFEDVSERGKRLELQISQLVEQKHSMLELFTRFKDAFPSDSLREVFGQIIDVVKLGHDLDQDFADTENDLLNKEGQLRKYAKREVEGLLSTKVINIRKEVEQGRHGLREMSIKREELDQKLSELELELKQNETIERRRTDVALETETKLSQTRSELQDARRELIFVQRNRNDLEIALKAQQQEREMVQRELQTLRHQLKLKADLNPDNFKSAAASTNRKLTSYNATQSSVQTNNHPTPHRPFSADRMAQHSTTVALRHGQLHQPTYRIEERPEPAEMPLKRRFPSQEPAIYTQQNNQGCNDDDYQRAGGAGRGATTMVQAHHHQIHSDMPLQMPSSLTDRMGDDKMHHRRPPSTYANVMSGGAPAHATTAAFSSSQMQHDYKPPTARNHHSNQQQNQHHQVLSSSRPPTYQSTQSGSKKSYHQTANPTGAPANSAITAQGANTTSFNPMPHHHQHQNSRNELQFATGNFPTLQQHHDSRDRPAESHSIQTMRHTIQGTRSNSMSNLHQNMIMTRSNGNLHGMIAIGAEATGENHHKDHHQKLQPIMSQYGGELTSRSGGQPHNMLDRTASSEDVVTDHQIVRRSNESPLRPSNTANSRSRQRRPTTKAANANNNMPRQQKQQQLPPEAASGNTGIIAGDGGAPPEEQSCSMIDDDSKLDANAYLMNHMSTQKSHSAYNGAGGAGHRSSVNESSIHNKLSALRNVFSQIRQNLDESSMTGTRTHQQSSIDQSSSLVQNNDYC